MKSNAVARWFVSSCVVLASLAAAAPALAQSAEIVVPSTSIPIKTAPPPLAPLARAAETPEGVAQRYFQALQQRGITASVDFFHPDELAKFKAMMLPLFALQSEAKNGEVLAAFFGAGATLRTVEQMEPAVFMRRILGIGALVQMMGAVKFQRIETIGSVSERPDIVHVVVRTFLSASGINVTSMSVVSLRPHEGAWKMLLSGDMQGLARALRMAVEKPQP